MNVLNYLTVGTKIITGYLIALLLMAIVGALAIYQMVHTNTIVSYLADDLANDQHLVDEMISNFLWVRFYVNEYTHEPQKNEHLKHYNEKTIYFEEQLTLLLKRTKHNEQFRHDEAFKLVDQIKTHFQNYKSHFVEITQLIERRNQILHQVLEIQGPLATKKLEQLSDHVFKAKDLNTLYDIHQVQQTLFLMRLETLKFFEQSHYHWPQKSKEYYRQVQKYLNQINEKIQTAPYHPLMTEIQSALNQYYQALTKVQSDLAQQNKIFKEQLDVRSLAIENLASNLSAHLTADFQSLSQTTHTFVIITLTVLLGIMILALIIDLGLSVVISRNITEPLKEIVKMTNKMVVGHMSQMVDIKNRDEIGKIINRQDEMGHIGQAFDNLSSYFNMLIEDVVQTSQGMAIGELNITPHIKYRGEFIRIKNALETSLSSLRAVIEDVVNISQRLAEGGLEVEAKAHYPGDFLQIKQALQAAAAKLADATRENIAQDWLKTGQNQLNDQLSGEQNPVELTHNIVAFLTTYLEAQVGLCYLIEDYFEPLKNHGLKLSAAHAYNRRKHLAEEFQFSEGLVDRAIKEQRSLLMTLDCDLKEEVVPRHLIIIPFLYEHKVKGVIVLGCTHDFTPLQLDFLHQVMPIIGIAVHTVESRMRLRDLLEQTQKQAQELEQQREQLQHSNEELQSQSEELQSQSEELQSQAEELRHTNEELEERTRELERQQQQIHDKNLVLEAAQQAIETKAKELELASKYKSEFLANMSHELRTPLNSLLILAQLLTENKEGNLSKKQVEYAQTIYGAGSDLLTLINEILDLSKIEAGKIQIHIEDVLLEDLLETLKVKFLHVAEDKGLKFTIQLAKNIPEILYTDAQRLKQIINNLLSNAFKFTSEGEIQLEIQRPALDDPNLTSLKLDPKQTIAIRVQDTGIGIPKNKQQLIFEAFQQVNGTTSRRYGGTGLGLSISRQLSRLLGGELKLQSEMNQGSTFTCYLPETPPQPQYTPTEVESPLVVETPSPTVTSTQQSQLSSRQPSLLIEEKFEEPLVDDREVLKADDKSILIIEDDRDFSRILMELSRERNFQCLLAENGYTGLQLAEKYQPHAIILDIGLPELDGWGVMEKLKENPKTRHIPVHFMSASDQSLNAKKMGAIGYLLKPVSMAELGSAFKKIEQFMTKTVKNLLIVADNPNRRKKVMTLVGDGEVEISYALSVAEAYESLHQTTFECLILDIDVELGHGLKLLEQLQSDESLAQIPVILYAERDLTLEEEKFLQQEAEHLTVKPVRSPERLLDEATLFLHQVEAKLPKEKRQMLQVVYDKTAILRHKKALIVDDDIRNSFALATILEDKEMEVVVGKNGKEALELLEQHPDVAIVLMDIMMPEMDGYEAMQLIRNQARWHQLPIIALTAKAMKGDKAKCIEAGANDYLAKPVDTDRLISLLRVWLYQ